MVSMKLQLRDHISILQGHFRVAGLAHLGVGGLLEWDEAPVNQQSKGRLGEVLLSDSPPPLKPTLYARELGERTGLWWETSLLGFEGSLKALVV